MITFLVRVRASAPCREYSVTYRGGGRSRLFYRLWLVTIPYRSFASLAVTVRNGRFSDRHILGLMWSATCGTILPLGAGTAKQPLDDAPIFSIVRFAEH